MRTLLLIAYAFVCTVSLSGRGEAAECSPACVNGQCSDAGVCVCSGGWAGSACDDCSQYFFGPSCNYMCQICNAHGTCTSGVNGFCECDTGWDGAQCNDFFCSPVCVHGICSGANTCTCNKGWEGDLCESAICTPACQNGNCFAPNMCDCNEGWSGAICEVCDSQHFGGECQHKCLSCDVHGTCHSGMNGSCTCDSGWQGILCDSPVCINPCSPDADCIAPGWCECREGYVGNGYECKAVTQCTGLFDWTPCTLEGEAAAVCFDENCEYVSTGDSCEEPLSLGFNVNENAFFDGMHPYSLVPEICAGKSLYGKDLFFQVDLEKPGWYELSAFPRDGLDIGLAVWMECTVDADKCIDGEDSALAGQPENLVFHIIDATTVILQLIVIGDESAERTEASDVSLIVAEHLFVDGDEELDVEDESYETIYDYEFETPESLESDGDLEFEPEIDDAEPDIDVAFEADFSYDIDGSEPQPEEQSEQDALQGDADSSDEYPENEQAPADSGGCSFNGESDGSVGILLLLLAACFFTRRRYVENNSR